MVEISFAGNNFCAYVPLLPGCVSTGNTPDEIKKNIKEAIDFHIAGTLDDGDTLPKSFNGNYELVYKFNAQSLLKYYKNVITGPALERYSHINQKQLNHYANGYKTPRITQVNKIKEGLHKLGAELLAVEL